MAIIENLRSSYPNLHMTFKDGTYRTIGDDESHILNHILIERSDGEKALISVHEEGRRKPLKPKASERRLRHLISCFTSETR